MPRSLARLSETLVARPIAAGWFLLCTATVLVYWPSLSGPFMFDDISVLGALGNFGGVRDWETFRAFVFGGGTGPSGRPLSLLSFLVDGNNWPADPWPFKRTNLVIHLINGVLIGAVIRQVLRLLDYERREVQVIALISVAGWMLHPFLVSTTAYVVQRMAQLATLFVFAGLAGYLYGRVRIGKDPLKAYAIMSLSVGGGTVLALLSKENGALLPLLVGVVEFVILGRCIERVGKLNRSWLILFLVVPSTLIGLYLFRTVVVAEFFTIVPPRDFSLYERVITQPRVLVDYLLNWFIPKLYTTGVFQDHFVKSTGMLAPVTTFLSMLFVAGLVVLAFMRRRQWPLFAFAVLFFFGSHIVESTVVNLELYFEHRNYLGAAFLFLPAVAWLHRNLSRRIVLLAVSGVLLMLGGFTNFSASVWQDYSTMVATSARKLPTSSRAQGQYALQLFNAGFYDQSIQVLDNALSTIQSRHNLLLIMRLNFLCHGGRLDNGEFEVTATRLGTEYYDPRLLSYYMSLVDAVKEGVCPEVSLKRLQTLFESMLQVEANGRPKTTGRSQLLYFVGYINVFNRNPVSAVTAFEASLNANPGASQAMAMAGLLATEGFFEEALELSSFALGQAKQYSSSTVMGAGVSEDEIRAFQDTVKADIKEQQDGENSHPEP